MGKAHSYSMDDVISPKMQIKIEDIIKEAPVEILSKEQVQLLYLAKDYEQESQEWFIMRKIIQIWSKENQKPEATSFRDFSNCRKSCKESMSILHMSAIISKRCNVTKI